MKSPRHPTPSGDRRIAQLFLNALNAAGFEVELASELRTWEGSGNQQAQALIKQRSIEQADRLINGYLNLAADKRPQGWFTYHLYHKAPDWIGPRVCNALNIPYYLAEVSVANKQNNGPWNDGYQQSLRAIESASVVFALNPQDIAGIQAVLPTSGRCVSLPPFLEPPNFDPRSMTTIRQQLVLPQAVAKDPYWFLTVAMMRNDAKLSSYRLLADSLIKLNNKSWRLFVVGAGPAQSIVRELFEPLKGHITFLGLQQPARISELMRASDLLLWPAVNEAIGMTALEALSCGLPVVAGNSGGISQIVVQNKTGELIEHGSYFADEFASCIDHLLHNPQQLNVYRQNSTRHFDSQHHINQAAATLRDSITSFRI